MGWEHFQKTTTWAILKADVMKAHRRINIAKDGWRFPGGTAGRRMVGKQGGNLWHGKCPTIGPRTVFFSRGKSTIGPHGLAWNPSHVLTSEKLFCSQLRGQPRAARSRSSRAVSWVAVSVLKSQQKITNKDKPPVNVREKFNSRVWAELLPSCPWLQRIIDGQSFTSKDIETAMGRLNWAASARPLRRPFPSTFLGGRQQLYDYLRETQQAHPLLCAAAIYSICSTILRPNLAHMILHRTGGGPMMPVHAQMDGHILEDG